MAWAKEYDCIEQFGLFLILEGAATADELDAIRKESKKRVREEQKVAWAAFRAPIEQELSDALALLVPLEGADGPLGAGLKEAVNPGRAEIHAAVRQMLQASIGVLSPERRTLQDWSDSFFSNRLRYPSVLAWLPSSLGCRALR